MLGLTTYRQRARSGVWDVHASFLPAAYLDGITMAGGIAGLLPPQPVDAGTAARVLDGVDGLVITGGADIDPAAYGHRHHPATDQPARDRDAWEFALLAEALDRHMPVLGICRGAQVINVALGGTLHQHLPDIGGLDGPGGEGGHRPGDAVFATSTVVISAGSRLAGLVGSGLEVQCYHHQAIDRLADGLVVSALSGGVIEAVEMPGADFVIGVQWHPEESLADLRLFGGLVEAARNYTVGGVR